MPRLTWRPTYEDNPDALDVTARIPGNPQAFLRVYFATGAPGPDRWHWFASSGNGSVGSGLAPDQRTAARRAVEAWKRHAG